MLDVASIAMKSALEAAAMVFLLVPSKGMEHCHCYPLPL
jgi:hypothetical protein